MGEWVNGGLTEIFENLLYVLDINVSRLRFIIVEFEPITSGPATQQKILISVPGFSRK
jgi:hypothetical protein